MFGKAEIKGLIAAIQDKGQTIVTAPKMVGRSLRRLLVDELYPESVPKSALGGYNRHRAVTAAASKRAAAKRRNLRKRSPH